jgi:hypothetical protein
LSAARLAWRAWLAATERLATVISTLVLSLLYLTVGAPFAVVAKVRRRKAPRREEGSSWWPRS